MQTSGPIKDYSRYASVTQNRLIQPQTSSQMIDQALFLYRKHFRVLAPLTLVPSILVSGFLTCFYLLVIPRLFETTFKSDTRLQILEFAVILFGGLSTGFFIASIGIARIGTLTNFLIQSEVQSGTNADALGVALIEKSANTGFWRAYRSMARSIGFVILPFAISIVPTLLSGLALSYTPDSDWVTGMVGVLTLTLIPIGTIWSLSRISLGIGAVSVSLQEGADPKASLSRSKYLFGPKSRPALGGNPLVQAIMSGMVMYLILLGGFAFFNETFGFGQFLLSLFSSPMIKLFAEIILSMLPSFLAAWLILPFISLTAGVFYVQRRVIVEGLDIQYSYDQLPASRR